MGSVLRLLGGMTSRVPRGFLYGAIGILVAALVGLVWRNASTGNRLDECRTTNAELRERATSAEINAAFMRANAETLKASIANQNAQIETMRSDAAKRAQAARQAADAHRSPPARPVPDDVEPSSVNAAVRERVQELAR